MRKEKGQTSQLGTLPHINYCTYCTATYASVLFRYDADTDHRFPQLNILHAETSEPLGIINWFAVHPTSMNNTNHLISGDNKGVASQMMEKSINVGELPGKVKNVASQCLNFY